MAWKRHSAGIQHLEVQLKPFMPHHPVLKCHADVCCRSDGEELQARPPPGSRLDQSEADLRARVMRALHKRADSQVSVREACVPHRQSGQLGAGQAEMYVVRLLCHVTSEV